MLKYLIDVTAVKVRFFNARGDIIGHMDINKMANRGQLYGLLGKDIYTVNMAETLGQILSELGIDEIVSDVEPHHAKYLEARLGAEIGPSKIYQDRKLYEITIRRNKDK